MARTMTEIFVDSVIVKRDNFDWLCEMKDAFKFIREKFHFKMLVVDENIIYLNVDDKIQIPISLDDYFKLVHFIEEEKVDYIKEVTHDN